MRYLFMFFMALMLLVGTAAVDKEHTQAEIRARHAAVCIDGKTWKLATYAEREVVPIRLVGANRAEIATSLGPPYPVSDRFVPEGGTYEEIYDTFDARWYVTYSDKNQPLKVEKTKITRDAQENKALNCDDDTALSTNAVTVLTDHGFQFIPLSETQKRVLDVSANRMVLEKQTKAETRSIDSAVLFLWVTINIAVIQTPRACTEYKGYFWFSRLDTAGPDDKSFRSGIAVKKGTGDIYRWEEQKSQ
jgi:hypothetical protein